MFLVAGVGSITGVAAARTTPRADRAGLVDAIFIAAYLANSLPPVIAGLASQHYGLHDTALVYNAVIAALAAAAVAMTSLRRRPPRPGRAG